MGDKQQHPFPWLNMLVTEPFYGLHGLAFFSYIIVRQSASQYISQEFSHHLLRREIQALLAFGVLVSIKIVKSKTWESFIADSILYAKGFLIMIASILDRRLAVWYLVGFIVIFLLCQQPAYSGQHGNINYLTPLQLESILAEGVNSELWLVEFRALWSSRCIQASHIFADLSLIYSSKNLAFGLVDLGRFPNAAAKYGITLGGSMGQLPTYILFENGIEVSRIPDIDFEGKVKTPIITKRLLVRHFELDQRFVEYLSDGSSIGSFEAKSL